MKRITLLFLAIICLTAHAGDDGLRHATDVMCLLPDATALGVTIVKHDTEGMKQLAFSTATCLVLNYGLELCIRKDRPDGTGHHAFPSTHTAVAFNGSTFASRPTATTGGTCWAEPPSEPAQRSSLPSPLSRMLT